MKKALCAALLLVSSLGFASEHTFSNVQLDNLHYAYSFGEQFQKNGKFKEPSKRYDNNGLGYIMAALAWQESSAGVITTGKQGHHAYGIFQNYLPTLRERVKQAGWSMTDAEIIRMLKNRKHSASWAYIELSYWLDRHNGDMRKAIASYNAGNKWKAGNKYASDVLAKANYLKYRKMLHYTVE